MRFLEESKHHHLQNKKTVQNHILFYRLFESGSAEICVREDAYPPRIPKTSHPNPRT
jgi:hypothetical protein